MLTEKTQIHEEWYQKLGEKLILPDPNSKKAILEIITIIDDFFDADSLEGHVSGLHEMLCGCIENKVLHLSKRQILDYVSSTSIHVDFIVQLSARWAVIRD